MKKRRVFLDIYKKNPKSTEITVFENGGAFSFYPVDD